MKTVEVERRREQSMWSLFMFLTRRPGLPANDPDGGDNQRAQAQQYKHAGEYDHDQVK